MAKWTRQAGFVGWLVALVVPPAVAGGLEQQFVTRHAVWAVIVTVAYEATVAVVGFFAVIVHDVSSRWQARLADKVDLFLQRKAARFERRYREFVLSGSRFVDHKGLATVGPFTPELDAVFVNVSLVPRPPQQVGAGVLPDLADERAGRHILGDFLGREKPAVLAVVGGPGSGKTTLLRHAARGACPDRRPSRRDRRGNVRDIPILLYLRDHAAAITADPAISVVALLRSTLGELGAGEPQEWFEQKLRDGRCLVLLDGLDEVARQDDRAKVSAWAEGQVRQYPRNDFVVSSRPQGYQSAPVEGAEIVQVCGFTSSQVEAFVRNWYRAAERHSTGTASPEADARAAEGADDLLHRLERTPALYDLTVNPLLLTMIANVHRYRSALPGSRASLYSEICTVMLSRRQDAKRLPQQVDGDKKEAILRSLAYTMMKHRVSDLSRTDVLAGIQPALRRLSRGVSADAFLDDVSSNGLLIERQAGQYAFAHKTFQEYLAAEHIRVSGLVSDLADAVSDDWWAETTVLYAAMSNADPIIRACLDAGTFPALALALDCTDQDSDVDPDLRERVNALVISAAGPDADPEHRRLLAGILLARHMRQRERTTAGSQVCTYPIPAEIYRLFLADTQTPEPDAPLPESGTVICMRNSDAGAFARWATGLANQQRSYRLPLAAELTELAARQLIPELPGSRPPSAWVQGERTSPETLPVLWLPPGTTAPCPGSSALLANAVESDVARSTLTLNLLLLQRSRVLTRVLAPAGAFANFPGRDVDRDLGVALDLLHDRARALEHDLDRACRFLLGRASSHDLELGIDRARYLDLGTDPPLDRDIVLDLVRDRDLIHVLGLAHNRLPGLVDDLHGTLGIATGIDKAFNRYLRSTLHYAQSPSIFTKACHLVLGRALAEAITASLRSGNKPSQWPAQFAAAFIETTGVNAVGIQTPDPATLEATLLESVKRLTDLLKEKPAELPSGPPWSYVVAKRMRQNAMPIFARAERPTPEKATAIRTAALCLAAEADAIQPKDIGDMFRQVAAGITVLEHRATGQQWPPEVIMLAVELDPWRPPDGS